VLPIRSTKPFPSQPTSHHFNLSDCGLRPPATRLPSPATAVRLDAGVRGNGGQVAWSPSASAEPRDPPASRGKALRAGAERGEGDWRAGIADCGFTSHVISM